MKQPDAHRAGSRRARTGVALAAAVAAAVVVAGCATQTGADGKSQPIFQSFNQCMVANGVGAVTLGLLVREVTGKTAAGVAATAGTLFLAWKACGQAHQRVTVSDERGRDAAIAGDGRLVGTQPVLLLHSLEVAAPKAGSDLVTRYQFAYTSPDATKKDIAAKERFVFLAGVPNDRGQQEFKEIPFERDLVIQQGQRRHEHAVPTDASFGQFKPWKLRYQLEADGRCVETEATFDFNGTAGRGSPARPCGGAAAMVPPAAPTAAVATSGGTSTAAPAASERAAVDERTLVRALRLQAAPAGALVGKSLAAGTALRVLETRSVGSGAAAVVWVRVESAAGDRGWTREANLKR